MSGCSHGMFEPAAWAADDIARTENEAATTAVVGRRRSERDHVRSPADEKAVVAVGLEAVDACEFGEAPIGATAGKHGDEVDGLGDQRARNRDDGFLDELLEPA